MNKRVIWLVTVSFVCLAVRAGAQPAGSQPAATQSASTQPAGKLPTVRPAEELLAEEIGKMIAAGHLRPSQANPSEQYWQGGRGLRGDNIVDYWHNPAETIYTLLRALPHVPQAMRGPLKEYIQQEWKDYSPAEYTSTGWKGAAREIFQIPVEMQEFFAGKDGRSAQAPSAQPSAGWNGWSFNPFNFYACWLYAKEFGGAQEILARITPLLKAPPADQVTREKPHVLNCYIAGYIGYLELQKLTGQQPSAEVQQWLQTAQAKRIELLAMDPRQIFTTEAGGFLYLVPECGQYLNEHAREAVVKQVNGYNDLAPMWFLSEADEASRAVERKGCPEGSFAQFYDYISLFNAKAFALRENRQALEKYLDVPGVWRGDLFYIQNLVSVIEATKAP